MEEMIKSKSIILFVIFVLGVVYISSPNLNYSENETVSDFAKVNSENSSLNI